MGGDYRTPFWTTLVTLLILLLLEIAIANGLRCYKCKSRYDAYCSDPFNKSVMTGVQCSYAKEPGQPDPNVCTKEFVLDQKTKKYEIVRDCGYVDPNKLSLYGDGDRCWDTVEYKLDSRRFYCRSEYTTCNGEKMDHCSSATSLAAIPMVLFTILAARLLW